MRYFDFSVAIPDIGSPSWMLAYATVDVPLEQTLASIAQAQPGVPIFGCTSCLGVFTPVGFNRGMHVLGAASDDGINAVPVIRAIGAAGARAEARSAAREMMSVLDEAPSCILMHATPGFEERLLEGIDDAFKGSPPPVYGGSAADDAMQGDWRVFCGTTIISEGFLLVGFSSGRRVFGSFVSGYVPTHTRGVVTCASNRVVYTIDHEPAAEVYNRWTFGSIQEQLGGGVVLHTTALRPLGRIVDKVGAMPRYLLSHPHQVLPDGALWFFCELKLGDELVMMLGSDSALLERSHQVVSRALAGGSPDDRLAGGILVYCAGCVSVLGDKAPEAAVAFRGQLRDAPFIGASTFGEQGCFTGRNPANRHGNLMCDAVIFEAPEDESRRPAMES